METALKVISLLLSYPTDEFKAAVPELVAAVEGSDLAGKHKAALARLAEDIAGLDIYDAQERYVLLFDRTRSLSLHLFEHVHGESRDRGQAMVDLLEMYQNDGFEVEAKELPDYLPMFLEFLSTKTRDEAVELLGQTSHILSALQERLEKRQSIYAEAFDVLKSITCKPAASRVQELLETPDDDPEDLEALDRIWEEEAVRFGGNAGEGTCGPDRLQRQVRAAHRRPMDGPQRRNA